MQENISQEASTEALRYLNQERKEIDDMRVSDIRSAIASVPRGKFSDEVCKLKVKFGRLSSSLTQDDQRIFQDLVLLRVAQTFFKFFKGKLCFYDAHSNPYFV